MSKNYPVVSGAVFAVVAAMQGVRAFQQWPAQIGPFDIPVWASWMAMVAAGALCVWAFRSRGK